MDSEWIQSRKIAYTSVRRHFAGWKLRQFVLDSLHGTLEVRTPENTKVTRVSLCGPSISLGRHEYAPETRLCLWLRYFDAEERCPKEIVMRFEDEETFEKWERKLRTVIDMYRDRLKENSMDYIDVLASFLKEQSTCHTLLEQADEEEESAAFFQSNQEMEQMDELDEMEAIEDEDCMWNDSAHEERALHTNTHTHTHTQAQAESPSLSHSKWAEKEKSAHRPLRSLAVPHMNILIMAVGTRGDIQPFTQLALRLRKDGHRVRVATHAMFRDYIVSKHLEFYPLAGDPLVLSEFMVKTQGFIIPTTPELLLEAPKQHAMVVDIINSCWGACIEPDPLDHTGRSFVADVIISNPVTYAHVHCAEALGVPLHLMFPQPWTPTKAFPHPLSCLSYQRPWCTENYLSYQFIDRTMWLSFEREINKFRVSVLGLEPMRTGDGGWNALNQHRVPFVKMWSPSLVPKPKDWGEHVDVVGAFFEPVRIVNPQLSVPQREKETLTHKRMLRSYDPLVRRIKSEDSLLPLPSTHYEPAAELAAFLTGEEPIVFVGFGSMVVQDLPRILSLFLEAAALANVKILVQVGWSAISPETFLQLALEAQTTAALVRETENCNFLGESLIFPSSSATPTNKNDTNNNNVVANMDHQQVSDNEEDEDEGDQGRGERERESESALSSSLGQWFVSLGSKLSASVGNLGISQRTDRNAITAAPISELEREEVQRVQSEELGGWDEVESDGWTAAKHAFFMGPCPHDWLFQKVHAVVHHGGAGTTAAGLRFGCPTWVCPFFGDQFFWGEMVHRAGLGPRPCPVGQLTVPLAVEALQTLKSSVLKERAMRMSDCISREDGVEGAVAAFYRHLPLEQMLCDVSLFRGECVLAQEFCVDCGMKMSAQISQEIHSDASLHLQDHRRVCCVYRDWSCTSPADAAEGVVRGVGGFVHETIEGVAAALQDPSRSGLSSLVQHQLTAGSLLYEKLRDGVQQSYAARRKESERRRDLQRQGLAAVSGEEELRAQAMLRKTMRSPLHTHTHSAESERCRELRRRRLEIRSAQSLSLLPHNSSRGNVVRLGESGCSSHTTEDVESHSANSSAKRRCSPSTLSSQTATRPEPLLCDTHTLTHSLSYTLEGLRAPNLLSPIAEEDSPLLASFASPTAVIASSLTLAPSQIEKQSAQLVPDKDPMAMSTILCDERKSDAQQDTKAASSFTQTLTQSTIQGDLAESLFYAEVHSEEEEEEHSDIASNYSQSHVLSHSVSGGSLVHSVLLDRSHAHTPSESASAYVPVSQAFTVAKKAMQLFKASGSADGRTLTDQQFFRLMHKSIARQSAIQENCEPFILEEETEAMIRGALRTLSRNKNEVDFVNFAVFFQDYNL